MRKLNTWERGGVVGVEEAYDIETSDVGILQDDRIERRYAS